MEFKISPSRKPARGPKVSRTDFRWKVNRGYCPVEMGTPIDVEYRDGERAYDIPALLTRDQFTTNPHAYTAVDWQLGGDKTDIMFWRRSGINSLSPETAK